MKMQVVVNKTGERITDEKLLMELAGLLDHLGFEDIGIMADGSPVVFDRCGSFGYLDPDIYNIYMEA